MLYKIMGIAGLFLTIVLLLAFSACTAGSKELTGILQDSGFDGELSILTPDGALVTATCDSSTVYENNGVRCGPADLPPGSVVSLRIQGDRAISVREVADIDEDEGEEGGGSTPTPTSSLDGASLYANYCAGCHNASPPSSWRTNRTTSQLTNDINSGPGSMPAYSGILTSAQVSAIVQYIQGISPSPSPTATTPVVDAAQIYANNCAGCHGANRQGGSGPALTTSALANRTLSWLTGEVNHSGRLTSEQIPLMANYLKGITPTPTATPTATPTPTPSGSLIDAAQLFSAGCSGCHGVNGQGGSGPALTNSALSGRTLVYLVSRVNHSGLLTAVQIPVMANALKGIIATGAVPPSSTANPHASLTWNGSSTCLQCHENQAADIFHSVHYQWKGSTPFITNGPEIQGKDAGSFNSFCVNILGNWNACGSCHAGLGAKPEAVASTTQFQNIDCLVCHQKDYKRVKSGTTFIPDAVNMPITMDQAVQTVHLPERSNCLQCHARSGGEDAFKRGDLTLAHGATADRNFDVHMATTGANLKCIDCHQWVDHHVEGRGADLRPSDLPGVPMCNDCHAEKSTSTGHATAAVNRHVGAVACVSCHAPTYGKDAGDSTALEMTEVHRTWRQSVFAGGKFTPTFTIKNNVIPEYRFWNRYSMGYNIYDTAAISPDTGNYAISRPQGSINDPNRRIYPFKFKTAEQPLMTRLKQLIALDTSVFFATGNPVEAIKAGLRNMGYADTEPYSWVIADEFLALNHEVSPKEQALTCADCHDSTERMDLQQLGYVLKGPQSTICSQCHDAENPGNYIRLHDDHLSEGINCNSCHTFSRVQPDSVPTPVPTPAPTPTGTPAPTPTPAINAAQIYADNCAGCHGANRQGGSGPALTASALANRSLSWVISNVNHSGRLTSAQIPVMADYLKGVTTTPAPTPAPTVSPTPTPMVDAAQVYAANCAGCHGANRQGGSGPALTATALSGRTLSWVTSRVNHSGRLTSAQIPVMADFLKNVAP